MRLENVSLSLLRLPRASPCVASSQDERRALTGSSLAVLMQFPTVSGKQVCHNFAELVLLDLLPLGLDHDLDAVVAHLGHLGTGHLVEDHPADILVGALAVEGRLLLSEMELPLDERLLQVRT